MIEKYKTSILLFFFFLTVAAKADIQYSKTDSLVYSSYVSEFSSLQDSTISELIIKTALFFLDKPYVASTLEANDTESLTINLHEFDCTTFVENCIVLSKVIKSGDFSFENYRNMLTNMRYRKGIIDGYTSRLHYTSEWIDQNEKNGVLRNISLEMDGQVIDKQINFMSEHPQSYKHLSNNPDNLARIKIIENNIDNTDSYRIIPLANLESAISNIQDGDIIVFATNIDGLDYSHIGIAYHKDDALHFIHASSLAKKVVVELKSLTEYCQNSKKCSGVSILRIN